MEWYRDYKKEKCTAKERDKSVILSMFEGLHEDPDHGQMQVRTERQERKISHETHQYTKKDAEDWTLLMEGKSTNELKLSDINLNSVAIDLRF